MRNRSFGFYVCSLSWYFQPPIYFRLLRRNVRTVKPPAASGQLLPLLPARGLTRAAGEIVMMRQSRAGGRARWASEQAGSGEALEKRALPFFFWRPARLPCLVGVNRTFGFPTSGGLAFWTARSTVHLRGLQCSKAPSKALAEISYLNTVRHTADLNVPARQVSNWRFS